METLTKLYEKDYFIYILLGVLVVLIVLFCIVLFAGKKKKKDLATENGEIGGSSIDKVISLTDDATQPVVEVKEELAETKEFNPEDLQSVIKVESEEVLKPETPIVPELKEELEMSKVVAPEIEEVKPILKEAISESVITAPFEKNIVEDLKKEEFKTFPEEKKVESPILLEDEVENVPVEVKEDASKFNSPSSFTFEEEVSETPMISDAPVFPETVTTETSEVTPVFPEETNVPKLEPVVEKTNLFTVSDELPKLNEDQNR